MQPFSMCFVAQIHQGVQMLPSWCGFKLGHHGNGGVVFLFLDIVFLLDLVVFRRESIHVEKDHVVFLGGIWWDLDGVRRAKGIVRKEGVRDMVIVGV